MTLGLVLDWCSLVPGGHYLMLLLGVILGCLQTVRAVVSYALLMASVPILNTFRKLHGILQPGRNALSSTASTSVFSVFDALAML